MRTRTIFLLTLLTIALQIYCANPRRYITQNGSGLRDGSSWENAGFPSVTALFQNYPNPFNPDTQIKFALSKTADVNLSVYNNNGQVVSQLASGTMNAGVHAVDFDGSKLNSGIYYYTLEVDGKS
ncbi:MAG: T9SS type A sorting domain-containing protein [Candidatus Delongbacteria bacterium]